MRSAIIGLSLIFITLLSGGVSAHPHHDEDPKATYEELSNYLEATFVAVEKGIDTTGREFQIIAEDGQKFFVRRTELTQALIQLALQFHKHSHAAESEPEKGWAALKEKIWKGIEGLAATPVTITAASAHFAAQYGIIPFLVFIAPTFPPYVVVTEILESMVMGPMHVWCTVSMAAYFSAVSYLFVKTRFLGDVLWHKGSSRGIWGRLKTILGNQRAEVRFRNDLESLYVKSIPMLLNHKDFLKRIAHDHSPVGQLLSNSPLWGDHYQAHYRKEKKEATPADALTVETLLEKPSISDLTEIFIGIDTLKLMIDAKLASAKALGKLLSPVRTAHYQGKLSRMIAMFHRAMTLAIDESPEKRESLKPWAARSYQLILESLKTLSQIPEAPHSISLLGEGIGSLHRTILLFRNGDWREISKCGLDLVAEGDLQILDAEAVP